MELIDGLCTVSDHNLESQMYGDLVVTDHECKFGRVFKAVALCAILERGMGSNPIACNLVHSFLTCT